MKRKLVIRPRAELDLLKHCIYLADHQPHLAGRLRRSAETAFKSIKLRPSAGAKIDHPRSVEVELRFVKPKGFKNYLVIYQVTDDQVVILRVLHASQDLGEALLS